MNPCLLSDVLSLSHHYFGAFTNPYTAFLNRRTVSLSRLSICLTSSGGEMKMFLMSSSPLRNAVLMSPEIRRYLCEVTHCMIKASDAADNVGLSRGTFVRSGSSKPNTHRRAFAFPVDFHVRTHLARMTLSLLINKLFLDQIKHSVIKP